MKEIRSFDVSPDEGRVLVGVPVVFGKKALIHDSAGDYYEVIDKHALDGADLSDVTLRTEHDSTRIPLARTPRTMQLTVEPDGLHMRAVLADTEAAREAYEAVSRGDLRAMSFAFTVAEGGSSYDPRTNTRTITAIRRLYEASLVERPAYAETSVEARSQMDEARQRQDKRLQLLKSCNQLIIM